MFHGFDGNQEGGGHYVIIRFLVRHMLMTFKPIRRTISIETALHLSLAQLETTLKKTFRKAWMSRLIKKLDCGNKLNRVFNKLSLKEQKH